MVAIFLKVVISLKKNVFSYKIYYIRALKRNERITVKLKSPCELSSVGWTMHKNMQRSGVQTPATTKKKLQFKTMVITTVNDLIKSI